MYSLAEGKLCSNRDSLNPQNVNKYVDLSCRRASSKCFAPWRSERLFASVKDTLRSKPSEMGSSCISSSVLLSFSSTQLQGGGGQSRRLTSSASGSSLTRKRLALRGRDFASCDESSFCYKIASNYSLTKLREFGALLCSRNRQIEENSSLLLKELVIPKSYSVRSYDLEGKVFTVEGDVITAPSPIAPLIVNSAVSDGSCFFMRPLYDNHSFSCNRKRLNNYNDFKVPCWKKYCTVAAFYIALADAGYCDRALPFLSVQWVNWRQLLHDHNQLKVDLLSSRFKCDFLKPHHYAGNGDSVVPVALTIPTTFKGKLCSGISEHEGLMPSITMQPFTDAEVFQLFYLQLIFRSVYDIRFSTFMTDGKAKLLRPDVIGSQISRRQPLAFEHPTNTDRWLFFPCGSRVIHILALEEAVVPQYSSSQECSETAQQRLFGATELLPCQGKLGQHVVSEWAMKRVVSSAFDAVIALEELFDLFFELYGVGRHDVYRTYLVPRVFRSSSAVMKRLVAKNTDLTLFFSSLHLSLTTSAILKRDDKIVFEKPREIPANNESCQEKNEEKNEIKDEEKEDEEKEVLEEDVITRRWRQYIKNGSTALFDSDTDAIEIVRFLGSGGSGLVYEGRFGPQFIPVAVKCFIKTEGVDHETYVKDSLTNVAFFLFFNQLHTYGILHANKVYDFVVCSQAPKGMPAKDVQICSRQVDVNLPTKLCYLVTDLMDGVIGRFLTEDEDDFDPCYDTIVNRPLRDGEVFQFLFTQLVLRALFNCIIFDLMLNGQLRGDNIGYRCLIRDKSENDLLTSYKGILIIFQPRHGFSTRRYLRFPADVIDTNKLGPLCIISFIDLGQGTQPNLTELTCRGLIGETVVDSCIQDDGFGRYWPLDCIYSKYIETSGEVAQKAIEWGANLCINSPQAAEEALQELFELYAPTYGVMAPTEEELASHVVISWTPRNIDKLLDNYFYK